MVLLVAVVVLGCSRESRDAVTLVAAWYLSETPVLSIGVVEGDEDYELDAATSSVRLSNGTIVVANTGSQELWFFDGEGQLITKSGGRGGGPGEFQYLRRVYRHSGDSVMAFDGVRQVSVFDAMGIFAWSQRVDSLFLDRQFPLDVWLHKRFWLEGDRDSAHRPNIMKALDRLEVPDTAPGYRFVHVANDGGLWINEPRSSTAGVLWTVVGSDGSAIAVVETPPRFDIHQIGEDFVLGRWRNADGINFVQLYAIDRTGVDVALPRWVSAQARAETTPAGESASDSLPLRELRRLLRIMAARQEGYFMDHLAYAERMDSLDLEIPEGLMVTLVRADERSWTAVATQQGAQWLCGMSIGYNTPPGWIEGAVHCGSNP